MLTIICIRYACAEYTSLHPTFNRDHKSVTKMAERDFRSVVGTARGQ